MACPTVWACARVHRPSSWNLQFCVHGMKLIAITLNSIEMIKAYWLKWKEVCAGTYPSQQNKNFVDLRGGQSGKIRVLAGLNR